MYGDLRFNVELWMSESTSSTKYSFKIFKFLKTKHVINHPIIYRSNCLTQTKCFLH